MADTFPATYLASVSMTAGSVATVATSRKDNKYSAIAPCFIPLAIETFGPIKFLSTLGDCLTAATDEPREASFLFQKISVLI